MFFSWVRRGLRTGVVTTRYPAVHEQMTEEFRGRPMLDAHRCLAAQGCTACTAVCLPNALRLEAVKGKEQQHLLLDYGRCVMCGLCVDACPTGALEITTDYELATTQRNALEQHALFIDAESGKGA